MSVAPPLFSGQFYQLPPPGSVNGVSAANAAQFPGGFADLLDSLSGDSGAGFDDAFVLSLSPAAQQAVESFSIHQAGNDMFGAPSGVLLSRNQQEQITAILTQYKDAPFTQETYEQIQADLRAAGLSADQLVLTQTLSEYDPAGVLLQALDQNGASLPSTAAFVTDEQSRASAANYMQQVVEEWRGISSTADT